MKYTKSRLQEVFTRNVRVKRVNGCFKGINVIDDVVCVNFVHESLNPLINVMKNKREDDYDIENIIDDYYI